MYASQIIDGRKRDPYSLAMDLAKIAREVGVEIDPGFQGKRVSFRLLPDRTTEVKDLESGKYLSKFQRASISSLMFNDSPPRKVHAVCWHGHYAFMRLAFERLPGLRIKSSFADYRSLQDFRRDAWSTYTRNAGSQMYPVPFGEACFCESFDEPSTYALEQEANEAAFGASLFGH